MAHSDDTLAPTLRPAASASAGAHTWPPAPPSPPGPPPDVGQLPPSPSGTAFATLAAHLRSGSFRSVELEPGSRVHHYVITGVIGHGGMSRVFDARHVYLGQQVALKTTLEAAGGGDPQFAERFLREAQTLASLAHPNVVRVFDANVWEGIPYVVIEKLHGRSMADELVNSGPLPVDRTLDVIEDVASVFERQEQLGIIHRDIKPNNLYLRDGGTTCVIDYGLVGFGEGRQPSDGKSADEVTKDGAVIGTPAYMAPEQFSDRGVGPWTDIYGLGMTAWQALTGKRPRPDGDMGVMVKRSFEAVPPLRSLRPDAPEGVERLLATMLAPVHQERYQSAHDLLRDLCSLRYRGRRIQGVTRGRVFVAMPFNPTFEKVWNCIEDASLDAKLRPTRVDRMVYIDNIWSQIVQEIAGCSVLVADFTVGWLSRCPNVNVVTETAHAVAVKKPVIVITQDRPEKLPFDWRHVPVIRYSRTRQGLVELRRVLAERLDQVGRDARLG